MNFYNSLFLSFLLLMILDISWIAFNFQFYMTLIKKIQKEPFYSRIYANIIAYICIFISFYLFVKIIAVEGNTLLYSLLFGLAVYGTYSYTNCASFKNYTYYNAFKDVAWGCILYLISGLLFNYLYKNKLII
jgi:uncharacterized membrane protein